MAVCRLLLHNGMEALVDEADYPNLDRHSWTATHCGRGGNRVGKWYATRFGLCPDGVRRTIYLHRQILETPLGVLVDHKNGDGLDCRRENLRHADGRQNGAHRQKEPPASGYRGVYADRSRFRARISDGAPSYKFLSLGTFATAEEAARVYDAAALAAYGEFAILNFPDAAGATA